MERRIKSVLAMLGIALSAFAQATTTDKIVQSLGATSSDAKTAIGGVAFDSNGNMFGTSQAGGAYGLGTVWEIAKDGTYSVLHSFSATGSDGSYPYANVTIDGSGNVFGTTYLGGTSGYGTVWEYSNIGSFGTLHSFAGGTADGQYPQYCGVTVDSSGNLYGTATYGGANNSGVIWEYAGGSYTVLQSFNATTTEGGYPYAGVTLDAIGNLYGTTYSGGSQSYGTIWKLVPGGGITTLHSFLGYPTDGGRPESGVTFDKAGNLYGTTLFGGSAGGGTVWTIPAGGSYSMIHNFAGGPNDGQTPYSGVTLDSSGNMYGTTFGGGANNGGTVWKIASWGAYNVLYSFVPSSTDASFPYCNVALDSKGNPFGTTYTGGANGNGAVWEILQSPTLAQFGLNTNTQVGGSGVVGLVSLSAPAQAGGYMVSLSSNSIFGEVPPTVTVPEGTASATFPIWTDPCSSGQSMTLTATDATNTFTSNLVLTNYAPSVFTVQVNPTYVVGGTSVQGLVQIDHFVSTIGGEIVNLSSGNVIGGGTAAATVPSSVVVPFGANSASFTINTIGVSSITPVQINATDGATESGLVMVTPPNGLEINLSVNPSGIYGGNHAVGTVSINGPLTTDTVLNLSSNNPSVTVPDSVTIGAGQTTSTFPISTSPVSGTTSPLNGGWIWVACSFEQSSQAVPVALYPSQVHYIKATPSSVTGGGSSVGTVYLSGAAPSSGITVTLSSSSADAQVPTTVYIPSGSVSANFTITTSAVVSTETVLITGAYGGGTVSCGFGIGSSVSVHTISASPSSVTGGVSSTGTVTLSAPAPGTGVIVSLSSSGPDVQVPATVVVQAGNTSATFPITTSLVNSVESLSISATLNNKTVSSGFLLGASVSMHYVTISPSSVTGGLSSVGTVVLNGIAPASGTLVSLSSSNPCAQVPPTVLVPAGASSVNFPITTTAVTTNTLLSISATFNNHTASYGFLVAVPNLSSLSITGSATIVGGILETVSANLNGPAPAGGVLVALSSNSIFGTVPTSVFIPAGSTSATFTLTTVPVTTNTMVTVTAVHTQTCHLTFKLIP